MSERDLLILPAGTPVIMVETLHHGARGNDLFLAELPKVHAGRLSEPHRLTEGLVPTLLMEGPFARSFAPGGSDARIVLWSDEGETMLIFHSTEGEDALRIRWILEDTKGLVAELEAAGISTWEKMEETRERLYRRVIAAYAFLLAGMSMSIIGTY